MITKINVTRQNQIDAGNDITMFALRVVLSVAAFIGVWGVASFVSIL